MRPMKILIVDDEPHLRMLIQQTLEELEDEGVDLITATNGEEALETIREEEPNLVFLDVMMPNLTAGGRMAARLTKSISGARPLIPPSGNCAP